MNSLTAYKCLECGHFTISRLDGQRCSKCKGAVVPMGNATNADKNKLMSVDISVKDMDIFKQVMDLLKEIYGREDVPIDIKYKIIGITLGSEPHIKAIAKTKLEGTSPQFHIIDEYHNK